MSHFLFQFKVARRPRHRPRFCDSSVSLVVVVYLYIRRPHNAIISHDFFLASRGTDTTDLGTPPTRRPVNTLERYSTASATVVARVSEPVGIVVLVASLTSYGSSAVGAVLSSFLRRRVPPVLPGRATAEPGRHPPAEEAAQCRTRRRDDRDVDLDYVEDCADVVERIRYAARIVEELYKLDEPDDRDDQDPVRTSQLTILAEDC